MGSLNRVFLHGNLGQDPEVRSTPAGDKVANFSIATVEKWTDAEGNKKEKPEWHHIVAWRKIAEITEKYLKKGSPVIIEGSLQTRSWDDKDSGKKMYKTEIKVSRLELVGGKREQSTEQNNAQSGGTPGFEPHSEHNKEFPPEPEDSLPF